MSAEDSLGPACKTIQTMTRTNVMSLWWPPEGVAFVIHCFVLLLDLIRFISDL